MKKKKLSKKKTISVARKKEGYILQVHTIVLQVHNVVHLVRIVVRLVHSLANHLLSLLIKDMVDKQGVQEQVGNFNRVKENI